MAARASRSFLQTQLAVKQARENPSDYEAQMSAARASFQAERPDDTLEFLLRANTLQPDNVEPVIALAKVSYDTGRYTAAEKWKTAALAKKPDDINLRTELGLTFLLRNPPDNERALTEFRRTLQLDPKHELALESLILALTRKGDKTEARAALAELESVNPSNAALPQLRSGLDKDGAGARDDAGKNGAGGKS